MYQFFNTSHVPPLDNHPINKHTGRVDCEEDNDNKMLYKEDISKSLSSPFVYGTSEPNSPVVQEPSSCGSLNDAGTSCLAGPEEIGAIESLLRDHVPCSPSLSNPDADCSNSCLRRHDEVGIETPVIEKVPASPTPRVLSALPSHLKQHGRRQSK
ncbi:hypothetical protein R1flu_004960 [Riccia fluitans]|uniref:Uncharacterized protein n=1 Tax=Riccia fluitans TaxID=41844 RepID=A0ABD1YRT0_9MARC